MAGRMFQATIQLIPSESGGKTWPVLSGYRSLVRFEGTEVDIGFELQLQEESLEPGESGVGCVTMWAEGIPDLSVGQQFEIREGLRIVGYGIVLDPFDCAPRPRESPG
jgi:translation elongation factor EF-Tu-like GTPase